MELAHADLTLLLTVLALLLVTCAYSSGVNHSTSSHRSTIPAFNMARKKVAANQNLVTRIEKKQERTGFRAKEGADSNWLKRRQRKTDDLFTKLQTDHLYEIVTPRVIKTSSEPGRDSADPQQTSSNQITGTPPRNRRSVQPESAPGGSSHLKSHPTNKLYELSAFGKTFHLDVSANQKFVSHNFAVEHRYANGSVTRRLEEASCHYTGHAHNSSTTSRVAISDCLGLFGAFYHSGELYLIEPLWNHSSLDLTSQLHVLYKQSVPLSNTKTRKAESPGGTVYNHTSESPGCGVSDDDTPPHRNFNTNPHEVASFPPPDLPPRLNPLFGSTKLQFKQRHRRKRSVSKEHFVETLVVIDKKMVDYHSRQDIEPFVLSVMNVVSTLYHDASIGNLINIVVSRLIVLLGSQDGLELGYHADKTLQSFCQWQHSINPAENSDKTLYDGVAHHDNAILLTRLDICSHRDEPCGTLGLAPVAGMCESDRSCSIVEDIGLASAFTIAHEMGHNFGMQHDGAGNECGVPGKEPAKLMASQLTSETDPFTWSRCSREYVTAFLDSGRGKCLENTPPDMGLDYVAPDSPGALWDASVQCQWQFSSKSAMCKPELMCKELHCVGVHGECITNSVPAAVGTVCDQGKRCFNAMCQPEGQSVQSVDGQWGEWLSWEPCSRTCGGGVESSVRHCDNPSPENGGKFCVGERKRYRSCNIEECPAESQEFRAVQCAVFDTVPFRGKFYIWKPFSVGTTSKPCALNCLAENFNFYTERAPKVVDGTRCYPDSLDICVNGECMHVGCDHVLGSKAREDKCRVCHGDGTSCTTIKGTFDKALENKTDMYEEVVRIPKGAVNILISERVPSWNYLALKTVSDNVYHINGQWTIDWPRKVPAAGTIFHYERPKGEPETLFGLGPLAQEIAIMILVQQMNLGIKFEYNVPNQSPQEEVLEFEWGHAVWSTCSVTCGGGHSISESVCKRIADATPVDDEYCTEKKPDQQEKTCNTTPCPARWQAGEWSECSATCGEDAVQTRQVLCVQRYDTLEEDVVEEDQCQDQKPATKQTCTSTPCPPHWETDEWGECDMTCGRGTSRRRVFCVNDEYEYMEPEQCDKKAPLTWRICDTEPCPPHWETEGWGKCTPTIPSARCGKGHQYRILKCMSPSGVHTTGCSRADKPDVRQPCEIVCDNEDCRDAEKVTYCPIVVAYKLCERVAFYDLCCRTCKDNGLSPVKGH